MAISDAFPGPVSLDVAGERVEFPLLKMSQLGAFERQIIDARNARLRRTADERKLNAEQSARFIEYGEMEEIELSHLIRHGASLAGSQEYVLASLKNAGKSEADAKAIIERMRPVSRGAPPGDG